MKFSPTELAILVRWMTERDWIRAKKAQGLPRPWTDDALLRDFRWCNVRRMDDRVSVALLDRWYVPDCDQQTALVAALLARLVNWPDSLLAITGGRTFGLADLPGARGALAQRAADGQKVFTGAYVVPGVPGRNKVDSVCDLVELIAPQASRVVAPTMRGTWAALIEFDGMGSFLAGQVVADLAQLPAVFAWDDAPTWAPLGPGSARGINRLRDRPKDQAISHAQFEIELPALIGVLRPMVPQIWEDRHLQAMDVQNCLCEFDKYRRLQLGEGKVRARYAGAAVAQESLL
ncbi:hypothetical protein GmRootV59_12550 [Variovorax sp. V59]|uniref:nucleotide kinase domain-containing protein n=1 Tax=unclassified Variovorax TaxID=663243 RepID=UPI0034E8FC36